MNKLTMTETIMVAKAKSGFGDYSMHIDKEENPAGDRVIVSMNGKFLPYRSW